MAKSQHGFPNLVRAKLMPLVRSITPSRWTYHVGKYFVLTAPTGWTLGSTNNAVLEVTGIGVNTYKVKAVGAGNVSFVATSIGGFSIGMTVRVIV